MVDFAGVNVEGLPRIEDVGISDDSLTANAGLDETGVGTVMSPSSCIGLSVRSFGRKDSVEPLFLKDRVGGW